MVPLGSSGGPWVPHGAPRGSAYSSGCLSGRCTPVQGLIYIYVYYSLAVSLSISISISISISVSISIVQSLYIYIIVYLCLPLYYSLSTYPPKLVLVLCSCFVQIEFKKLFFELELSSKNYFLNSNRVQKYSF